ncbi:histone deacetylase 5-like isoform X4 [Varroa jacobsoni]|uniref:histone deacetylase 5-like isoform X4 n=1 Tax=Varroa jacobsoni TaxID=62625 RepID=UPI000BF6AB45|nr:histone deacetylase 5-like isoform X4 [Varroa jacobsoni]
MMIGKSNGTVGVPSVAGPVEILKRPSWGVAGVNVTGIGSALTPVPLVTTESATVNATTTTTTTTESCHMSGAVGDINDGGGTVDGEAAPLSAGPATGSMSGPRPLPMDYSPFSNSNSPPVTQSIMPLIEQESEAVLTVSPSGSEPLRPSVAGVTGPGGTGVVAGANKIVVPLLELQQQLVAMKQEQQLQQQLLLQSYRHQQRQLAQQHEMQLQERVRMYLEQQQQQQQQQQQPQETAVAAAAKSRELERQAQAQAQHQQQQEKDNNQGGLSGQQSTTRKESPGPAGVGSAPATNSSCKKDVTSVGSAGPSSSQSGKTSQPQLQRTGSGGVSAEVKQKLAEFVLAKKQREAAQNGVALRHPWAQRPQMSLDQSSPPPANGRPGASSVPGKSDFPLRKTASEPNLKVRSVLKQKVMNRSSPLLLRRRGEKLIRRRIPVSLDSQSFVSTSEGSPPSAASAHSSLHSSFGSSNGTPISEELGPPGVPSIAALVPGASSGAPNQQTPNQSACSVLTSGGQILEQSMLYSSPSMPNISLGRPSAAQPSPIIDGKMLSSMSEVQVRAMAAARLGLPLVSYHVLQPNLAFCSQLPVIDGDVTPPTSPVFVHSSHLRSLEQQSGTGGLIGVGLMTTSPMATAVSSAAGTTSSTAVNGVNVTSVVGGNESTASQARLQRSILRPLGRTQSAPLPLGHPLLQSPAAVQKLTLHQQQQQQQQQQHQLIKHHIRHTVLTRASSKSNVLGQVPEQSSVVEENEEMNQDDDDEQMTIATSEIFTQATITSASPTTMSPSPPSSSLTAAAKRLNVTTGTVTTTSDASATISVTGRGSHTASQQPGTTPAAGATTPSITSSSLASASPGVTPLTVDDEASEQKQQPSVIQRQRLCSESSSKHQLRRLSRTLSSPLVSLERISSQGSSSAFQTLQSNPQATALVYDSVMLKHQCVCGHFSEHPEHAGRLQSVWARLQETGLVARCVRLRSRKATLDELQLAHSEAYTLLLGTNPLNRQKLEFEKLELPLKSFLMLPCGGVGVDLDTTWNELHTAGAARMAAGCVIELACRVTAGDVKNGFAVVRPPGHHAEHQQAMGFCFFNSLAVAAKKAQQRFNLERILIVDWDVHHGNGIQQIFYRDPRVLYISMHRHDEGNFFPGTGDPHEIGEEAGRGFNVNVAWSGGLNPPMGDAEYLAAFRSIVMPIARDYRPQLVLVACGFDAAKGHKTTLGGYNVSAACFGAMTRQLMSIANGKVVLALEGGYDLPSVCDCSEAVTRALLGEELCSQVSEVELTRKPVASAIETLKRTAVIQAPYWPCTKQWAATIGCSSLEAMQLSKDSEDTVTAMALLSVARQGSPDNRSKFEEPMDQDKSNM